MTLEGWTLSKYMCAGLIPDVNIKSRPRVFFIFAMMMIDKQVCDLHKAVISSPEISAKNSFQAIMDMLIPPLSSEKRLKEQAEKMFKLLDKITNKIDAVKPQ